MLPVLNANDDKTGVVRRQQLMLICTDLNVTSVHAEAELRAVQCKPPNESVFILQKNEQKRKMFRMY